MTVLPLPLDAARLTGRGGAQKCSCKDGQERGGKKNRKGHMNGESRKWREVKRIRGGERRGLQKETREVIL